MPVSGLRGLACGAGLAIGLCATACGTREPQGTWVWSGMMELPAGVEAEELPQADSTGARLAARYCSQCHGVPTPLRHSAEDWVPTLRRMFARMEHMSGMGPTRGMMGRGGGRMGGGMGRGRRMPMGMHGVEAPSAEEQRAIVEYYRAHALPAVRPGELPEGDSGARELFRDRCSRCHALPNPAQHTPEEWPAVVDRMRGNMERMGVGGLTDAEAASILEYLQDSAATR